MFGLGHITRKESLRWRNVTLQHMSKDLTVCSKANMQYTQIEHMYFRQKNSQASVANVGYMLAPSPMKKRLKRASNTKMERTTSRSSLALDLLIWMFWSFSLRMDSEDILLLANCPH
jgi:hypothetical protein